ncbi:unnamed protein product [Victoria cruziana]
MASSLLTQDRSTGHHRPAECSKGLDFTVLPQRGVTQFRSYGGYSSMLRSYRSLRGPVPPLLRTSLQSAQ